MGVLASRHDSAPTAFVTACLDALLLELPTTTGLSATLLHQASPLVQARALTLPALPPGEDWSALSPELVRLAAQLQLDYVAAVELMPDGDRVRVRALVVVRGGGTWTVDFEHPERQPSSVARTLAQALKQAIEQHLPRPRPLTDDVPLEPVAVAVPEAPATAPAETAVAPVAQTPTAPPAPAPQPEAAVTAPTPAAPEQVDTEGLGPLEPAAVAFNRGRYREALALLQPLIAAGTDTARAYLLRARCELALNNPEAALDDLRRAVQADPNLVEAHLRLGRLLAERGLWQAAADSYKAALNLQPDDREARLALARLYRDHGHRQRALELLEAAPSSGDAGMLLLQAELYALQGDEVRAESTFQRALAASSGDTQAVVLEKLGDFYVSLRRHREALTCYLQAAQLNPARGTLARRRYDELMRAADNTVCDELTASWAEFAAFVRDGQGERELLFARMATARAHLDEAMRFADSIIAPDEVRAIHARRQFAYSVAYEATVTALSYIDLGGTEMRERAVERYQQALAEFARLREGQ